MKRVTTGAYMASAMVRSPYRNGPPDWVRHSRQIVQTRSISACARDQILKPGKWPFRLTGSDARSVVNPEWISPQIERQCARKTRSAGSSPASGLTSLRYSAIASVSHTVAPSCRRHGTRIEDDSSRISARAEASSGAVMTSSNSSPENLVKSQPRNDHDEEVLLEMVSVAFAIWLIPQRLNARPGARIFAKAYRRNVPIIYAWRPYAASD